MTKPINLRQAALLPCPFCGGRADVDAPSGVRDRERLIYCTVCHVSAASYSGDQARAVWNRRVALAQPQPVDRGDAVNLARNVLAGAHAGVTEKGLRTLCEAVMKMDAALRAALEQPQADPVALHDQTEMAEARRIAREYAWPHSNVDAGNLYWALHVCLRRIDAAPAQAEPRKPLTRKEALSIVDKQPADMRTGLPMFWRDQALEIVRAVEAAHGIGDKE